MRALLLRGAAAGALAGLLTSIFHLLLTAPVLELALALEQTGGEPLVSRTAQKYIGAPAGQVLAGIAVGLLFAVAYRFVTSTATSWRKATGLAFAAFLVLALIPQLRYPANPPGVGDPGTIDDRTSAFLLVYALALAVVSGAYGALRYLDRRGVPAPVRQSAVVAGAVVAVGVGFLLLPDNIDPVNAPADIVYDFRIRALGGLAVLFATLGAVFGVLTDRQERSVKDEVAARRVPA